MIVPLADLSRQRAARIAGLLYLILIISGIYAEFFVRSAMLVKGDAAATAGNIIASAGLFRSGIGADLLMIICDIALALIFYFLFEAVSRILSLLAAFFRLVQAAILGFNLLNLLFVLQLVSSAGYRSVFEKEQLYALVILFLNGHQLGYAIGLVFFGMQCLVLGYLIARSGFLPKVLGILLIVAGAGYLTDSLAKFLLPNYAEYETIFSGLVFLPAFVAELALCLWLLLKGIKTTESMA
jgi:hypothetical protein